MFLHCAIFRRENTSVHKQQAGQRSLGVNKKNGENNSYESHKSAVKNSFLYIEH